MNLNEYYRNHKDAINSSIMEIACDLAVGQLLNAHDAPFETFVEADDPDYSDSGNQYKEEFQKEYDKYYDEEYARVLALELYHHACMAQYHPAYFLKGWIFSQILHYSDRKSVV